MASQSMFNVPIYVVTSNAGKVQEIQTILQGYDVRSVTDLIGPLPDIVEDGNTFEKMR